MENGRESAYMSKDLATIIRNVPLGITLSDIAHKGLDRPEAKKLFLRYNLLSAIKRCGLDKDADESSSLPKETEKTSVTVIESADLTSLGCEIYAISLTDEKAYISDGETVIATSLSDALASFVNTKKIITWDCKALYKSLDSKGIHFRDCYFDVMLGAYVDDSSQSSYELEKLIGSYLGDTADESTPEAYYVAKMWQIIEKRLADSGQLDLLYNIEMPLAAVLCDMENAGFKIDREGIAHYGEELEEQARALEERIYSMAGEEFNINSPKQLGEVLFEKLMLPTAKKTKTGYSTNAEVLEGLRKYHPVIDKILNYRTYQKLNSTYVEGMKDKVREDGRIYTTFNQTETRTGRISSGEPNLQNIPVRTQLGQELRKFFVAKDGCVLLDADYSQIELRILAHISGDESMRSAFINDEDIHTQTAAKIMKLPVEMVTPQIRSRAKAVNFGIVYGIGAFSLAKDVGITVKEASQFIQNYLDTFVGVKEYMNTITQFAKDNGYVSTLYNRKRILPEISNSNRNIQEMGKRMAMNTPIQGTSADIIKIAMVKVAQRLKEEGLKAKLILQVHDELIVEAPLEEADRAAAILGEEMRNAAQLSVPLKVDVNRGENWYVAKG